MAVDYTPTPWLPGPHSQTIGARLLRRSSGVTFARERLELPDGDFLDLDWPRTIDGTPAPDEGPLVLVLHGLEGNAYRRYMLEGYRALARVGLGSVGLNFRSCSGEPNRLPRLYHSGDTGDIAHVLETLHRRSPDRVLGAMGFSLGGNALLKYLGERGRDGAPPPTAACAAISVPYDLAAGERVLRDGAARIYLTYLLRKLHRKVRLKSEILREHIDVPAVLATRTFRDFDHLATAPIHGFDGADDYYRRSSSAGYLDTIGVPTVLIHALDDPFLPPTAVPTEVAEANPALDPCFVARGGHVGFVQGTPFAPHFWAEATAAAFLARHLRPSAPN